MQLEAWNKAEKALDSSIQEDLLKNSFTIKQNNFVKWDYLITGIIIFTIAQKTVLLYWVAWPGNIHTTNATKTKERLDITYQCYCYLLAVYGCFLAYMFYWALQKIKSYGRSNIENTNFRLMNWQFSVAFIMVASLICYQIDDVIAYFILTASNRTREQ